MTSPADAQVAVVGGGLSGLIAGRELLRCGVDVVVLEAADRLGGRALTETTALGSNVDLGGQWIGHDHHRLIALADELGATRFAMHTCPMPVVIDGSRRITAASPEMLTAGAVLVGLAALARTGLPRRSNSTTVRSWLTRVPGRTARRLLEVLALVSWTADLDRLSVYAMARLVRQQGGVRTMLSTSGGAQDSLLVEGMGALVDGLAAELGTRIRPGCRVLAVSSGHDGVVLETDSGRFRAAKAIIAVPPPMAAKIVFDPPLPQALAGLQRNTYMGSAYKALAVYERPFWRAGVGGEFIVLDAPGFAVFDSSPPGGPGQLTVLCAGPDARRLTHLDSVARRGALLGPLSYHIGPEVLEPVDWREKAWHTDEFVGGGYSALPIPGTFEGIPPTISAPVGNLHWAGTETATDHAGYFEGAIESGMRAAGEAALQLR